MATIALAAGDGFPVLLPAAGLTSCRPLLSLLQEDDTKLKFCALQKIVRANEKCIEAGCLRRDTACIICMAFWS